MLVLFSSHSWGEHVAEMSYPCYVMLIAAAGALEFIKSQLLFCCQQLRSHSERLKPLQPNGARSKFSLEEGFKTLASLLRRSHLFYL